jgi:hypothetical protein
MFKDRQSAVRQGEVPMLTKWMLENRLALRVMTTGGGMTALAVVLAAPTKWCH